MLNRRTGPLYYFSLASLLAEIMERIMEIMKLFISLIFADEKMPVAAGM
jgi:hypothetical protein